jgi:hypothetical protein
LAGSVSSVKGCIEASSAGTPTFSRWRQQLEHMRVFLLGEQIDLQIEMVAALA